MASFTPNANLRQEIGTETYNVNTTLNDNWTKIDSIFDPTGSPSAGSPKAFLRETAVSPTYTASAKLINLTPTWNGAGATLYGIYMDVTHSAAAAGSRPLAIRRGANVMFDVDITTNSPAVNGLVVRAGANTQPVTLMPPTADAADNAGVNIAGGGEWNANRGAYISVYGNENAGQPGNMQLVAGETVGEIKFYTGAATLRGTLDAAGLLTMLGGLTLASGTTLTLTGVTVTGLSPTFTSLTVGSAASTVLDIDTTAGSTATLRFEDAGIAKWSWYKAADNTLRLFDSALGADRLTFTTGTLISMVGNLGVGVVPETWTSFSAIQIGQRSSLAYNNSNGAFELLSNSYNNSGYKAIVEAAAARIIIDGVSRAVTMGSAPSAVVDGTHNYVNYFFMDSAGTFGLGAAADGTNRLLVSGSIKVSGAGSRFLAPDTGVATPEYGWFGDTNMGMYRAGDDVIGFGTNGTLRMSINNGNVVLGSGITIMSSGTGWVANGTDATVLGSTGPNAIVTPGSTYAWLKWTLDDGSTVYIPTWK